MDHLKLSFKDAMQFYAAALDTAKQDSPEALRIFKANLAKQDLFFLMFFVLRQYHMANAWLYDRCREVQASPDDHLDLWAREHYKSSIITFGLTIFTLINDPEETICIFSHTKSIARKFLVQIKTELEKNEQLKELYPDIFHRNPVKEAIKWSEDAGIIIKRKSNPKEASVEAHGLVDGQPTSRHFGLMVYDDIVTMESVSTADQIKKTTEAFQMSDNLGKVGGRKRYIGTRYHLFDTYEWMMREGVCVPRIHPATVDGTESGTPVLMPAEVLRKKRIAQGPYTFSSQMLLNPVADMAMSFSRDWLVHEEIEYQAALSLLWRFIIVDPSSGKRSKKGRQNNDYTTMWVVGYGEDEKYRVLDCVRDRLNLSDRAEELFRLHKIWKPELVAYEDYGMQADIEHIKSVQNKDLYSFNVTPIGGSIPKRERILRLVPTFEQGRIILPMTIPYIDKQGRNHNLVQDFIEEEYAAFPVLKHDDMIDCLARIECLAAANMIRKPTREISSHETRGYSFADSGGNGRNWRTV